MIDLQLFLNAAPIVQTHIGSAVFAVGVGPLAVFRRRRDGWHKLLGYFWVMAIATLAVTSFFITGCARVSSARFTCCQFWFLSILHAACG